MTATERKDYSLATLLAVIIHLALLVVSLPPGMFGGTSHLDIYSAGLVEFKPGTQQPVVQSTPPPKPVPPKVILPKKEVKQPQPKPQEKPEKKVEVTVPKQEQTKVEPKPEPEPRPEPEPEPEPEPKPEPKPEPEPDSKLEPEPEPTDPAVESSVSGEESVGEAAESSQSTQQGQSLGDGSGMFSRKGVMVRPVYPKNSQNEGVEGDVTLRVLVSPEGILEDVETIQSSGDSRLDRSAEDFITREWRFNPNVEAYYIDVVIMFRISELPKYQLLGSQTRLSGGL